MPEPIRRSSLSLGMDWASRVTTVGLEFSLPALAGVALDRWLGIKPWGVLVGATLGFAVGMAHLLKIAKTGIGPGAGDRPA
jgi:ATP synthase protein I